MIAQIAQDEIAVRERATWLIENVRAKVQRGEAHPGDVLEVCAILESFLERGSEKMC